MTRMPRWVALILFLLALSFVPLYLWAIKEGDRRRQEAAEDRARYQAAIDRETRDAMDRDAQRFADMVRQGFPKNPPADPRAGAVPPAGPSTPANPPAIPLEPPPAPPPVQWQPVGLSGGGAMFTPAISPVDANRMMLNCDMSGAYTTRDGGRHWTMINCNQLGSNTRCRPCWHPTDPDTVYAAGGWSGRMKVSHDAGVTWESIGDIKDALQGAITIDPARTTEETHVYGAHTADGTPAYGDNGEPLPGPGDPGHGILTKTGGTRPPQRFLVGTAKGALISTDGAKTFRSCDGVSGAALGFHFDQTSPNTPAARVCFAATAEAVFRSDDGGQTWHPKIEGLPPAKDYPLTAFAGASNAEKKTVRLYLAVPCKLVDGQLTGGLYRSIDRGESWQRIMQGGLNVDIKSYDEWADGSIPQYTHVLTCDADPKRVYAFNRSTGFWPPHHPTVYRSDDGGDTWRATLFLDPRFKGQYNVEPTYHTATMQRSYQEGAIGAAIAPEDPDTLIRVGGMNAYITHDGGKTWFPGHTHLAPGQKDAAGAGFECNGLVVTTTWHYYIDPFKPNLHYIGYTDIGFGRSTDAGKTWAWWTEDKRPPWTNTTYELAFDPTVPGKVWGAFSNVHDIPNGNIVQGRHNDKGPGGVALSTDFAANWEVPYTPDQDAGLPLAPVCSLVIDPKSPQEGRTLYAAVFDHGIYKTTDGGKTWAHSSKGLGDAKNMRLYRVLLHPDGTLFAVITGKRDGGRSGPFLDAGVGVYRSTDGAATWEKISQGQPWQWCKDLSLDPHDSKILYVGVCDTPNNECGGLWRTQDGGQTWQKIGREARETFGGYPSQRHPGWIYMTLTEGAPGAGLWLSKDDGKTWLPFQELPFHNIMRSLEDPSDDSKIYLSTFGGSVWHGPAEPPPPATP